MKFIELVREHIEYTKPTVKIRTYYNYTQYANCYIANHEIGNKDIRRIKQDELNQFLVYLYENGKQSNGSDLSKSTIEGLKGVINRALKYACKKKYLNNLQLADVKIKKKKYEKVEALTKEEQTKIEKHILNRKEVYRYGFIICLYTGVRIGELLSLKWEDIDFKHKIIKINSTTYRTYNGEKSVIIEDEPKTESSKREIPLVNMIVSLLKELKEFQNNSSKYVISRKIGKKIETRAYEESFTRLLKKLNIRHYKFHCLRHTFATRCLEAGVDIKTLSEIMGHSSPTVTLSIYVHTDYNLKKNALNKITKKFSYLETDALDDMLVIG